MPDVEVAGNFRAGGIADGQLRNLHQAGLDGVDQAEVADDPGERLIRLLPDATKEIRRCRQVDAEVDPPHPVDAVQPLDPDGGFFLIGQSLVFVLFIVIFVLVRNLLRDAIGVVGLVVQDQNVLLAADLASQNRFTSAVSLST